MNKKIFFYLAVLLILFLLPVIIKAPFLINVLILIFMYAMLAQAWDLLGGYTGQISFGNAIFFGIGAYTSTLMYNHLEISPWLGMITGGLTAVILAVIVGYPAFKLKGHYFLLATIGIAEIIRTIFVNWTFVGGAQGLYTPLKEESFWTFQFHSTNVPYYYIILSFFILSFSITYLVERSKLGYYFKAIREDEDAAKALGINTQKFKFTAFAISSFLTAMAGSFYAQYVMYIDPYSVMPFMLSVQIVLVAILGGMGYLHGPLLGALVLIPLSEATRVFFGSNGNGLQLVLYGLLIMIISIYKPAGLAGWIKEWQYKRLNSMGGDKS